MSSSYGDGNKYRGVGDTTFVEVVAYECGYKSGLEFALRKCKQHLLAETPIRTVIEKIEIELKHS